MFILFNVRKHSQNRINQDYLNLLRILKSLYQKAYIQVARVAQDMQQKTNYNSQNINIQRLDQSSESVLKDS